MTKFSIAAGGRSRIFLRTLHLFANIPNRFSEMRLARECLDKRDKHHKINQVVIG